MGRYINTKGEIEYHFEPYISDSVREPGYIYSKTEDGKIGWVDHEGNYVVPVYTIPITEVQASSISMKITCSTSKSN